MIYTKTAKFSATVSALVEAGVLKTNHRAIVTNLSESTEEPTVTDHHNPTLKLIIRGQEVPGCLIDGGLGVNMISKSTCDHLGIKGREACSFWLLIAKTRSVRPLGFIRKLEIVVSGYEFDISTVVLPLDAPWAYPLLLGRPWLRAANIKKIWQHNNISFCHGRTKIRVSTQEIALTAKELTPLYEEDILMLQGLEDEEVDQHLEENPWFIPLFKIDVIEYSRRLRKSEDDRGRRL